MRSFRILAALLVLGFPMESWAKSGGGTGSGSRSGSSGFSSPSRPSQPTYSPKAPSPSVGASRPVNTAPPPKEVQRAAPPSSGFTAPKAMPAEKATEQVRTRTNFDSAAQRAREVEESRRSFEASRAPVAPPKSKSEPAFASPPPTTSATPATSPKPAGSTVAPSVATTQKKEEENRYRYTRKEIPSPPPPPKPTYSAPTNPSQPTIVYHDTGLNTSLWLWLLAMSQHDRDQWVRNNPGQLSETQYREMENLRHRNAELELRQRNGELERRNAELAAGSTREPDKKVLGSEPIPQKPVKPSAVQTPRVTEVQQSGSWLWTFVWSFLILGILYYLVFVHKFKRSWL